MDRIRAPAGDPERSAAMMEITTAARYAAQLFAEGNRRRLASGLLAASIELVRDDDFERLLLIGQMRDYISEMESGARRATN